MNFLNKKDKKLGVADGKRIYDLPLEKNESTVFLVLLVGLMSFLACLSLGAAFALGDIGKRWSSGLENRLTIEIPAKDENGITAIPDYVTDLTNKVVKSLQHNPAIKKAEALGHDDIAALLEPWLGEADGITQDLPMPGLISLELTKSDPATLEQIKQSVQAIAPLAQLDTHESWLSDLLRFTGALQFAAFLIVLVIGITTVTAVAGAIHARITVNHAEIELLHIMGAHDSYITGQFQRHALRLSLEGSIIGLLAALAVLGALTLMGSHGETHTAMPDIALNPLLAGVLLIFPSSAALIAILTTRATVLRDLARMP
jgi:cell division transport system permease protein